jgi:hypothetical protein
MGKGEKQEIMSGDDWNATSLSPRDEFIDKLG